jgi:hypothetical protein
MDPTQCYKDLLNAINANDMNAAWEAANDLKNWLSRGGFYPVGYDRTEVFKTIQKVLFRNDTE